MSLLMILRKGCQYSGAAKNLVGLYCSNVPDILAQSKESLQVAFKENIAGDKDALSVYKPATSSELSEIARNLSPTYNFAAYVNESETLQEFVKLGVDLSKLERKHTLAQFVLQLNFEFDVKPYIQFVVDLGVPPDDLGTIFTKNVLILKETFEDLHIRVNYLKSKKFDKNMIAAIVKRNPYWLTTPVPVIDARLGWLQGAFKLKGDDVRQIVNALPQLVTFDINAIKLNMFVLEEEMCFSKSMIKHLLLSRPRIFIKSQQKLLKSFEFVHNVMKVPTDLIVAQPDVLMERVHTIKERHLFLESLGRAQYNPLLPGYISLDAIIKTDEVQFCSELAKSSIQSYNLFLRTL